LASIIDLLWDDSRRGAAIRASRAPQLRFV